LDDGTAFAIYLAAEGENEIPEQLTLPDVIPADGARLSLLGTSESLRWESQGSDLIVFVPESARKRPSCDHAWVIRISALKSR
jgi:alpha-L-fucosidase